jgi:preprotein translocase subunit SecD
VLGLRHIASAVVTQEGDPATHSVTIVLTTEGRSRLKNLTSQHVGRRLAIVIDNEVVALPAVMRPIDTGELPLMPIEKAEVAKALAQRINEATLRGGED